MRKILVFLLAACLLVSAAPALALNNDDAALADNWYEIFVYSFADGNGDRIGDFVGLKEKLPYLQSLHVDGVWLMPIHPSPSYHKYDVTDYCAIDPQYGTMEDFQAFLEAAHEAGIKVILDLVVNHTSSEHPWFQAARASADSPYRAYYNFSDTPKTGYNALPDGTYSYSVRAFGYLEKTGELTVQGGTVDDTQYGADIHLTVSLPEERVEALQERLTELSAGGIRLAVLSAEFRPGPRQEL